MTSCNALHTGDKIKDSCILRKPLWIGNTKKDREKNKLYLSTKKGWKKL